jgi:hypothetical protein
MTGGPVTLARNLWSEKDGVKVCGRCESPVHKCSFLGTEKHDSACLVSLKLDIADLNVIQSQLKNEAGKGGIEDG